MNSHDSRENASFMQFSKNGKIAQMAKILGDLKRGFQKNVYICLKFYKNFGIF